MATKSSKALNAFLATIPGTSKVLLEDCETYGSKTRAYVSVPEGMRRPDFERKLEAAGFVVHWEWNPKTVNATEVEVSYRKARGWDE